MNLLVPWSVTMPKERTPRFYIIRLCAPSVLLSRARYPETLTHFSNHPVGTCASPQTIYIILTGPNRRRGTGKGSSCDSSQRNPPLSASYIWVWCFILYVVRCMCINMYICAVELIYMWVGWRFRSRHSRCRSERAVCNPISFLVYRSECDTNTSNFKLMYQLILYRVRF